MGAPGHQCEDCGKAGSEIQLLPRVAPEAEPFRGYLFLVACTLAALVLIPLPEPLQEPQLTLTPTAKRRTNTQDSGFIWLIRSILAAKTQVSAAPDSLVGRPSVLRQAVERPPRTEGCSRCKLRLLR